MVAATNRKDNLSRAELLVRLSELIVIDLDAILQLSIDVHKRTHHERRNYLGLHSIFAELVDVNE